MRPTEESRTLAPICPSAVSARRRGGLGRGALALGLLALALTSGCAPAADQDRQAESHPVSPSAAPTTSDSTQSGSTQSGSPGSEATAPSATSSASTPATSPSSEPAATSASPTPTKTAAKKNPSGPKTLPANNLLVVVNKHTPLAPLEYAPNDLVNVGNGQLLRSAAANGYQRLVSGASAAGYSLAASSGYRSYATQVQTHNHWRNQYGAAYAERISARPGYSEHQTGLAIDVMPASGQCRLEVCFGTLPEGRWVAANAHKYGFIIRYPQGQESVTGYSYEPWHLRYVGVEAASSIKSAGQTMEAFYGYPAAPNYR